MSGYGKMVHSEVKIMGKKCATSVNYVSILWD